MKKVIIGATSIILVMIIMAVTIFTTIAVTEAKYLPVDHSEYELFTDRHGNIVLHENVYLDWSGSITEAICVSADNLTGNVFHLVEELN